MKKGKTVEVLGKQKGLSEVDTALVITFENEKDLAQFKAAYAQMTFLGKVKAREIKRSYLKERVNTLREHHINEAITSEMCEEVFEALTE